MNNEKLRETVGRSLSKLSNEQVKRLMMLLSAMERTQTPIIRR